MSCYGGTSDLRAAFSSPRTLALAGLTASLISLNWGVYVWAVANEQTMEAALGYYINPLVNVVLGALFLGERFHPAAGAGDRAWRWSRLPS